MCYAKIQSQFLDVQDVWHQKKYMCDKLRFPLKLAIRAAVARLKVLNTYLPEFPGREDKKMMSSELMDCLLVMIPHKWNTKMAEINFDPYQKTWDELVEYLQKLEQSSEVAENKPSTENPNPNGKRQRNSVPKEPQKEKEGKRE